MLLTFVSLRMAPLAVVCSKLASSRASPASASANLMASALYSWIACSSVLKLPAGQLIIVNFPKSLPGTPDLAQQK